MTYEREGSMFNTPNTFGIYMIGEVCTWIREQGGLAAMAERNARKAKLLYEFLDNSRRWRAHARVGSRSSMNVTFRGATPELEAARDLVRAREDARLDRMRDRHRLSKLETKSKPSTQAERLTFCSMSESSRG